MTRELSARRRHYPQIVNTCIQCGGFVADSPSGMRCLNCGCKRYARVPAAEMNEWMREIGKAQRLAFAPVELNYSHVGA